MCGIRIKDDDWLIVLCLIRIVDGSNRWMHFIVYLYGSEKHCRIVWFVSFVASAMCTSWFGPICTITTKSHSDYLDVILFVCENGMYAKCLYCINVVLRLLIFVVGIVLNCWLFCIWRMCELWESSWQCVNFPVE